MADRHTRGYQEALRRIKENYQTKNTRFNLNGLGLTELPPEIGKLKHLAKLYIGHGNERGGGNYLKSLPKEITQLKNLRVLYLDSNQLSELPKEIIQLKNLQSLHLSGNQLSGLPKEIAQLTNLRILNLYGNQLSEIPKEIAQLTKLKTLFLNNNQLNIPPEILGKVNEPQVILNYYFENVYKVKEDEIRPLKEVKVLLVGQGRVGKTSLVKYLIDNQKCNPNEPSTHGIIRRKWKIDVVEEKTKQAHKVQLNIWDFGGQDIQHQTHQFFLNERSVYLLVLDAGRDEAGNKLDYWLKKIQTMGKDAPILVAVNKSEQNILPLAYTDLKEQFNIREFFNISCENGQDIEELRQAIKDETGKIEKVFEPIRKEWFAVKEYLENLEEDYISRDDYRKICRAKGVTERQSQDTLLILLHELGIMLNFKEHETEVLNPEWVTRGVYKVVTSLEVQKNNGILTPELLDAEIRELNDQLHLEGKDYLHYPPEKYIFIKELMEKFELAYQIEDTENYFVPSLLPKDSPYVGEWDEKECLGFRYNYENGLLHESIMSRFIVRMNKYILNKTQWLTGVLLKNEHDNKALVKADLSNGYLNILIDGNENTRREFLAVIRDKFADINKNNTPKEEVPLKNYADVFVDYELLLQLEKKGINESHTTFAGKLVEYNVEELLNSVTNFSAREYERSKDEREIWKREAAEEKTFYDVALSYAGEDRWFVEKFAVELKAQGINVFYDGFEKSRLLGKDLYIELADIYSNRSKYVIVFVSKDYAEKIWTRHEIRNAFDRDLRQGDDYIIPARFDATQITGLRTSIGYADLREQTLHQFVETIVGKLK
jgi:internalin A